MAKLPLTSKNKTNSNGIFYVCVPMINLINLRMNTGIQVRWNIRVVRVMMKILVSKGGHIPRSSCTMYRDILYHNLIKE